MLTVSYISFQSHRADYGFAVFLLVGDACTSFVLIFIICEAGQRIGDAFEEFNDIINRFSWYRYPTKIKRILWCIQKGLVITNFWSTSILYWVAIFFYCVFQILNKSFSFFMVLRQFVKWKIWFGILHAVLKISESKKFVQRTSNSRWKFQLEWFMNQTLIISDSFLTTLFYNVVCLSVCRKRETQYSLLTLMWNDLTLFFSTFFVIWTFSWIFSSDFRRKNDSLLHKISSICCSRQQ